MENQTELQEIFIKEFPDLSWFFRSLIGKILPGYPNNIREDGCDFKFGFYNLKEYIHFKSYKDNTISFSLCTLKNEYHIIANNQKDSICLYMYPFGRDKTALLDTLHIVYSGNIVEKTLNNIVCCIVANEMVKI